MLQKVAAVLFHVFLLLPLHDTLRDIKSDEKSLYFSKLTHLYEKLGISNGADIARRQVFTGILSDAINAESKSPREEKFVRDTEIIYFSEADGSFEVRLVTDSLRSGLQYALVRGTADFSSFGANVSSIQKLDASLYAEGKLRKGGVMGTSFNNGSKGINELLSLADHTRCRKSILDECERGSVVMDTWANQTLAFQRWLQTNLTFDLIQTLGTHNSFNNKADGYGTGDFTLGIILEVLSDGQWEFVWAQQWFTMTDQLNMGVRHLMLDPVFFWDKMRLCHCGTTFKWFDKVLQFIEKTLNITIQFDSDDLGCMPYDRTLEAGLQEIYDWVIAPGHEEEVVMIHLNDKGHSSDWGHIDLIQEPVAQIYSDLLFTPEDKKHLFPTRWPTPNELVRLGKRVIVTCTARCNDTQIFLDMHVPDWDHDTTKYFTVAPKCGGFSPGEFYLVGGESQVVGPIYNGPKQEGLIIQENFPYLTQCPVTISEMDLVSPPLIAAAIWTWAPGFSHSNVTTTNCPAVDTGRKGRWIVLSCSVELVHMCQNVSNISDVELSTDRAPWGSPQCPQGYLFSVPQTGYVNWILYAAAASTNTSLVWINLPPSGR